jgi:hypothetical protein
VPVDRDYGGVGRQVNPMKHSPFKPLILALLLVSAFTRPALAMEIQQYDKMAQEDRLDYIVGMVDGAEKVLTDAGRPADAGKVRHLFTTNAPGGDISIGMAEFMRNLARLRVADAENVVKNPKDPRIEVEDAMAVTLTKNGIKLPDTFFTVSKDFKPKYPPAKQ